MEERALGATGIAVSALGFGCGSGGGLFVRGSRADQLAALRRAIEAGITYLDTAPSYGDGRSEANLGRVLAQLGARERVAIGTKVRLDPDADPPTAVRASVLDSLRRLRTDRVELVQLHNRIGRVGAREVAGERLDATVDALEAVRREGLVRAIGCTALGDTESLVETMRSGAFETAQCYVNAANPSAAFAGVAGGGQDFGGVIREAASRGLGVLAIRVFAAGALVGSMERSPVAGPTGAPIAGSDYPSDVSWATGLIGLARNLGLENALELSLRFVLAVPGVSTALVGFSEVGQLEDALRWAARGPLPADALDQVVAAARSGPRG